MSLKPESAFRKKVNTFLDTLPNCHHFSIQQVAINGTPDKLVCISGLFVALEIKSEDGEPSELQKYNLDRVEACGGTSIVVAPWNWVEVQNHLKKLSELWAAPVVYKMQPFFLTKWRDLWNKLKRSS